MNTSFLANLVITKVHSASTLYTPQNTKLKRNDRQRWAVVIKYEGETVYTSGEKRFLSNLAHVVILPKMCIRDRIYVVRLNTGLKFLAANGNRESSVCWQKKKR